jgi:hypothetical protein
MNDWLLREKQQLLKRLDEVIAQMSNVDGDADEYEDLEWELDDIQDELELRDKEEKK